MVTLATMPLNERTARQRIEILGVFGSGKTTLAEQLAGDLGVVLAERHEQNPFWGDTMAIDAVGYLPYDLSFLLQHVYLTATKKSTTSSHIEICDWSFASDSLWASMRLDEDDLASYEAIFRTLTARVGSPIGYLYLRQQSDVILSRLHQRGREPEAGLVDYIATAVERLDVLAKSLPAGLLLTVDNDFDQQKFRDQLRRWSGEVTYD